MRELEDDQCGVCGCYCFSAPTPWPWKFIETPGGRLQVCSTCFDRYEGKKVPDPHRDYVRSRLYGELRELESRQAEIEDVLERLDS